MEAEHPPLPPFTLESAVRKVRLAEDAWNTRDPGRVALAYTPDSAWRKRAEFFQGREAIVAFLTGNWDRELDYRLIKVWAFDGHRIAVRFPTSGTTIAANGFAPTATRTKRLSRNASGMIVWWGWAAGPNRDSSRLQQTGRDLDVDPDYPAAA